MAHFNPSDHENSTQDTIEDSKDSVLFQFYVFIFAFNEICVLAKNLEYAIEQMK